ncbi:MAG: hypothetical protein K8H89_04170 [Flavobacteriales bacterium]|jgi:hypothetical protein|nr:hypothetical protein [Flavobacteriales bacterium]MCB0759177.1 hypothetical protein [Flavobacteriales bacterium]
MKAIPTLLLFLLGITSCKAPQFIQGGEKDGVAVSYRWNHKPGKPSELLLKIANESPSAQRLHLGLDLYYQAFTVEEFTADTCIPAGRTFNGKLNGIYFIPRQITPEQAASPDTKVQLTEFTVEQEPACP